VGQDWGGLLGLTLPMEAPHRYAGLLAMNTAFATCDLPLGQGFLDWREWNNKNPDLAAGMKDPVLGPPAMRYLARQVRGCPPPSDGSPRAARATSPAHTHES
jgi:tRNA(adenine34) deaminase